MGQAREEHLVGAWGQSYATLQQGVEHLGVEAVFGDHLDLVEAGGFPVTKEQPEQRTHPGQHGVEAGPGEGVGKSFGKTGGRRLEALVGLAIEEIQGGLAGRHGQRVPGQGPRLVHAAQWGQVFHDLPAATEGADGKAAADHLAEAPQVRLDLEPFGGPSLGKAKPADHLVEDQQGSGGITGPA